MIYSLNGNLTQKHPTMAVLDVSGVGYGLSISIETYERLGEVGEKAFLFTYLHVREDALQLFGFHSEEEREMFLLLISVSGIGPRLGIGILSGVSVGEFCSLIKEGNAARIKRIPGIGAKTADRLILELKGKVDKISVSGHVGAEAPSDSAAEAMLALQSLGYKQAEVQKALTKISQDRPKDAPVEELIKVVLKELM